MAITTNIIQVILVSLIVTFVCAPLSIWIAKRAQLIDFPGSAPHKCHLKPTPMAGGVLLVLAFLVSGSLLFAWRIPGVAATFGAGLVVFLFGLCDDLWDISPIIKLIGQILAALILIQSNVWMQFFEPLNFILRLPPLMLHWLSVLMTIFWLVAITNAFNFIDSMDGLAVGIGGLVAVFIMFFSIDSGLFELAKLSVGLAALCTGVYFFNAKPALLFLGDAGAQVLGFWLAVLAIIYHSTSIAIQRSPWFTIILIMGVPIFDMTLVVVSRLLRGHPVYLSARDHTYHRLVHFGIHSNRAVLMMHIATVFLGCLAIVGLYQPPVVTSLIFGFVVICGLVVLVILEIRFPRTLR